MIFNSDYYRKRHGFFALSVLMLLFIMTESCNSQPVTTDPAKTNPTTSPGGAVSDTGEIKPLVGQSLPEDFNRFYNRFHEDSSYQMDHIIWPLEGLPNSKGDGDTLAPGRFYWQKAEWKRHKHFTDPGNNFQQWFEMMNDRIIEHWVLMKGTDMYIVRRFAKIEGEWYLIYYQGLRPTKR